MKRVSYKTRVSISVGLLVLSVALIIIAICLSQIGYILVGIAGPILAMVSFILFVVIMPKTNEDGTPIVIKKNKKNKQKSKKIKKPFMSSVEQKAQEDEDDEMIFIEEIVEDD